MNYQDALDRALSLAHNPAALEAFLRTVPSWRASLERAVSVSHSLSRDLRTIAPSQDATQRSQQQLLSVVSRLATDRTDAAPAWPSRLLGVFTMPRIAIAGVAAAVLLAVAFSANLPSLSGGGAQTAEALVFEGNVAEVGTDAVTISTANSSQQFRLSSDTVLTDGFGNTVEASRLTAGQDVVLKGSRSGDDFVASEVELRDRLFGVVTALPGDGIHLSSANGDFVLLVTPDTKFEGLIAVGSFVEVKLTRSPDGTLVALEVEVEDDGGEDEHEGDDHESSGSPPASPVAAGTPSGNSGPSNETQPRESEDDGSSHGGSSEEGHKDKHDSEHEDD